MSFVKDSGGTEMDEERFSASGDDDVDRADHMESGDEVSKTDVGSKVNGDGQGTTEKQALDLMDYGDLCGQKKDDEVSVSSGIDTAGSSGESLVCLRSQVDRNQKLEGSGSFDSLLSAGASNQEEQKNTDDVKTDQKDASPPSDPQDTGAAGLPTVTDGGNDEASLEMGKSSIVAGRSVDRFSSNDSLLTADDKKIFKPIDVDNDDDFPVSEVSTQYSSRDSLLTSDTSQVAQSNPLGTREERVTVSDRDVTVRRSSRDSLLSDDTNDSIFGTDQDKLDTVAHAQSISKDIAGWMDTVRRYSLDESKLSPTSPTYSASIQETKLVQRRSR